MRRKRRYARSSPVICAAAPGMGRSSRLRSRQPPRYGRKLSMLDLGTSFVASVHWACQFAGIVITPINWRAKVDEIDYAIENSGAKAIVFETVSAAGVAESAACR